MALLEEQFTESESLDAGATPIKYEGDVERQREVAEKLWAQLNPQQQMQFGSFEQFFSSGAWKKVLELIMQQQQGEGQNMMEGEGAGVMEQGPSMQAPPLPPTPSPMVNPGQGAMAPGPAGGMGQRPMMPQPRPAMARGGIAELFEEEEIEEPGFDEIEEEEVIEGPKGKFRELLERVAMRSLKGPKDPSALTSGMMSRMRGTRNLMEPMGGAIPMGGAVPMGVTMERASFPRPGQSISGGLPAALPSGQIRTGTGGVPEMRPRLASHDPGDASSEAWFNLWKEHPQGHMFPTLDKFISWYVDTTDYDPDRMAQGGRIGFGLGSFVKKAFKKAKRAVKKVAKSPIGKAALAGAALYATRGMWNPGTAAASGTGGGSFLAGLKGKLLGTKAIGIGGLTGAGPASWASTTASTPGILGALNLTRGAGSLMPTAMGGLGLAMASPYLFPNLGAPDETPKLAGRGDSPDINLDDIRGRVQAAYQQGPDAVAALQQEFPYLLPYGSAKLAQGGRIRYAGGSDPLVEAAWEEWLTLPDDLRGNYMHFNDYLEERKTETWNLPGSKKAQGGRIGAQEGGLMNLGGMEKDYRQEGGFVPIGGEEKADDVPARLSKNEFVFTADAVRSAGGGDIDQGAEVMENVMNNLEQGGQISEESQGLQGARDMFATSERLSEVV